MKKTIPIRLNHFHNGHHYVVAAEVAQSLKIKSILIYLVRNREGLTKMKVLDVTHGIANEVKAAIMAEIKKRAEKSIKNNKIKKNLLKLTFGVRK